MFPHATALAAFILLTFKFLSVELWLAGEWRVEDAVEDARKTRLGWDAAGIARISVDHWLPERHCDVP